jgi:uncharacterized membrane-anchored protein/uncharacterized membrane protein
MQVDNLQRSGSELHSWRSFLSRASLSLAIILLAAAAVCWVAANWPDMGKFAKLAGAQGLLALCALAAALLYYRTARSASARHARAATLGLAGAVLGALLALVGQIYQTGADGWELFAWWAVLLLPWALVARSTAVWLLWVLVADLAVALLLGERVLSWWIVFAGPGFPSLVLAAANLIMLAVWEVSARQWHARTGVGPRVLALLAVGVLVLALMFGDSIVDGLGTYTGIAWVAATAGLGYFYIRGRRDVVILALLAAGVICVSLRVVGEWLLRVNPGPWVALPLAALLMGEAVLAARWLRRLAPESARRARQPGHAAEAGLNHHAGAAARAVAAGPDETVEPIAAAPGSAPWYVQGLLGLSAWFATLLLLAFVFLSGMVGSQSGALVLGLVLCAAGVAIVRAAVRGPFWRQCGTAMAFGGLILFAVGLAGSNSPAGAAAFLLALAVVVYVLGVDPILRFLAGCVMAVAMFVLTNAGAHSSQLYADALIGLMQWDTARALGVLLPATVGSAWVATVAFLMGARLSARGRSDVLRPLAWAFAIMAQVAVALASGVPVWALDALWHVHHPAAVATVFASLLPMAACIAVQWPMRARLGAGLRWGLPICLLILGVFWMPSPGIAFALTWMLIGFALRKPRVHAFGIVALLVYLLLYYYELRVPLLEKAVWLAGAGVLLLVLRALAARLHGAAALPVADDMQPSTASAYRAAHVRPLPTHAQPRRAAWVVAGLALVLAVVNAGILQRERILSGGRVVRLELAPADPRGFMQGDYMSLRFAAAADVGKLQDQLPRSAGILHTVPTDGYLVVSLDKNDVATPVRVQIDANPHSQQEVALRYRLRAGGVRIATNAYFFPEGEAHKFQDARYGEFRVDDHGTALLVRLLGPELQPL